MICCHAPVWAIGGDLVESWRAQTKGKRAMKTHLKMFPEAVLDSPRKTVILPPLLFLLPLFFIFLLISALLS